MKLKIKSISYFIRYLYNEKHDKFLSYTENEKENADNSITSFRLVI